MAASSSIPLHYFALSSVLSLPCFILLNFMLSRFDFYYLSVVISLMYVLRWLRVEEFL